MSVISRLVPQQEKFNFKRFVVITSSSVSLLIWIFNIINKRNGSKKYSFLCQFTIIIIIYKLMMH